ncbi:fumarase fum1 [Paraconiothyrium brasiliense]|uniref:Fumarase fum1 n=1 Tax=Paraconiothyrium brasiliense TaxID=300254 RepID=A0ABR3QGL2_9PLEO
MSSQSTAIKPAALSRPPLNAIAPHLRARFDPIFVRYHEAYAVGRLHTHQVPITDFRANPRKYITSFGKAIADAPNVGRISDIECPVDNGKNKIKIRVYEPREGAFKDEGRGRPVFVNYHGGGWVFGDIDTDTEHCKRIVNGTGAVVFDVEYRCSPEHPFPVPVEDAWDGLLHVVKTQAQPFDLDTSRVAVGGPSAGGHLSAVVAQRARDAGIPLVLQQLHVPVCDMDQFDEQGRVKEDAPYESYREMYETVPLSGERMEYFARHFLGVPREQGTYNNPAVSPIRAPSLANLAPALVVTAEMDPLRDEGYEYYKKLKAAGNEAEYYMMPGMPHTAAILDDICEEGKKWNDMVVSSLKKAYGLS